MLIGESIEHPCPGCHGTQFEVDDVPDIATGTIEGAMWRCIRCGYEEWHQYSQYEEGEE